MKGYHIHGRIGKTVKLSQLHVGDLYWDILEQCPYLITDKRDDETTVMPLMPNGEEQLYCWDVNVRFFTLIKEHISLPRPTTPKNHA